MSRYIDADAILKHKCDVYDINDHVLHAVPTGHIISAPSIDIVRCKECRHWEMRNSPRGWCVVHQGYVSPQYFCADGEREGE